MDAKLTVQRSFLRDKLETRQPDFCDFCCFKVVEAVLMCWPGKKRGGWIQKFIIKNTVRSRSDWSFIYGSGLHGEWVDSWNISLEKKTSTPHFTSPHWCVSRVNKKTNRSRTLKYSVWFTFTYFAPEQTQPRVPEIHSQNPSCRRAYLCHFSLTTSAGLVIFGSMKTFIYMHIT